MPGQELPTINQFPKKFTEHTWIILGINNPSLYRNIRIFRLRIQLRFLCSTAARIGTSHQKSKGRHEGYDDMTR